jgi:hypothetical protein
MPEAPLIARADFFVQHGPKKLFINPIADLGIIFTLEIKNNFRYRSSSPD